MERLFLTDEIFALLVTFPLLNSSLDLQYRPMFALHTARLSVRAKWKFTVKEPGDRFVKKGGVGRILRWPAQSWVSKMSPQQEVIEPHTANVRSRRLGDHFLHYSYSRGWTGVSIQWRLVQGIALASVAC